MVKVNESLVYVVETKGREDLDDIEKIKRLKIWCDDVNINQSKTKFLPLYVKQDLWNSLDTKPRDFKSFAKVFEDEHLKPGLGFNKLFKRAFDNKKTWLFK